MALMEAYEALVAENTKYTKEELAMLKDSLKHHPNHEPSSRLRSGWESQFGGEIGVPDQIKRDQLIVDHMYSEGGMKLDRAIDLWDAWEDYEYKIKTGARG